MAYSVFLHESTIKSELLRDGIPSQALLSLWKATVVDRSIRLGVSRELEEEITSFLQNFDCASVIQQASWLDASFNSLNPYIFNEKNFNRNVKYVSTKSTNGVFIGGDYIICTASEQETINAVLEKVDSESQAQEKFLKVLSARPKGESTESYSSDSVSAPEAPTVMTIKSFLHTLPWKKVSRKARDGELRVHSNNLLPQFSGDFFKRKQWHNIPEIFQLLLLAYLAYLAHTKGVNTYEEYAQSRNLPSDFSGLVSYAKKIILGLRALTKKKASKAENPLLDGSLRESDFLSIVTGILLILRIFQKDLLNPPKDNALTNTDKPTLTNIQNEENVEVDDLVQTISHGPDFETGSLNRFEIARTVENNNFPKFTQDTHQKRENLAYRQDQPSSYSPITPVILEEPKARFIPAEPQDSTTLEEPKVPILLAEPQSLATPEKPKAPIIPIESKDSATPANIKAPVILEKPKTTDPTLYGDGNANFISGTNNNDKIVGAAGDDVLLGKAGDDHLIGGLGDDVLRGGLGADTLDGGAGSDIASYADANTFIEVDLLTGHKDGAAADDTFISIEGIEATPYNDIVRGDGNDNDISGLAGNDTLEGRDGDDKIDGGAGIDQIKGGNDNDTLSGGIGDDEIFGGDGDDLIRGDLNRSDTQNEVIGGNDTLHGGKGDDRIGGKTGDDQIFGNEGDDELFGGLGNDWLVGGFGNDTLTGLSGSDSYVYNALDEGVDTITDFNPQKNDTLLISGHGFSSDLVLGELSPDAFTLGTAATNSNTRFIYDQTSGSLLFDPDGTGSKSAIEFVIFSNNTDLDHSDISIF